MTAGRQIPKHKESLPLAEMSPVRHIYQKCEMRIRGLKHTASCFPPAPQPPFGAQVVRGHISSEKLLN